MKEGKGCLVIIAIVVVIIIASNITKSVMQSQMMKYARSSTFVKPYDNYMCKYGVDAKFSEEAYDSILSICSRKIESSQFGICCKYEDTLKKLQYDWQHYNSTFKSKADNILKQEYAREYQYADSLHTIESWKNYKEIVPTSEWRDASERLYKIEYEKALETNTIAGWNNFKAHVPSLFWQDADIRIDELETNLYWRTEFKAWERACELSTLSGYEKYISLYPNGLHSKEASKKVIDLQVDAVFHSNHGSLPQMDHSYYSSGINSHISVDNDTGYTLTLLYSGTESKQLTISPHRSSSVTLKNGHYRVAAHVNASDVIPFAGTEDLVGGSYSVSYYIEHSRKYY